MMQKLHILLIAVILVGVAARFTQLDAHYLNGDEEFYIVGAQKFHAGSDYDVRLWNYHSPPVGKYLMSLPLSLIPGVDYSIPYAIPPNLWVWNYVAYESIEKVYTAVRAVSAVFGALFILFTFLIARELSGKTAGLWGAASAAISIDFILLSRVALVDMILYAFIASTMFFYIKYRKTQRSFPWLIGLFVSLILMFGTKNAQWMVVIPPLLYVEIVGNRKNALKTAHFLVLLGVAWFIHSSFIYPPEFSQPAYEFFTQGVNRNFIEPHLDTFFTSLISINSFFFLATFVLTIAFILGALGIQKKSIHWSKVRAHLLHPTPLTFLLLVALVSLVVFSLTSLSQNSKYVGQISIPFFALGGYAAARAWDASRAAKAALLILLVIGAASALWYFPFYEGYPGQQVQPLSNVERTMKPQLAFLEARGNPPVITNEMNLLLFYKGQVFPVPVKDSPACTQELLDNLKAGGVIGVFKNVGPVEEGFLCSFALQYAQEIVIDPSIGSIKAVTY